MPHIILFEDEGFFGNHKHVFREIDSLNADKNSQFNDKTSSFVILDGSWQFFYDPGFKKPFPLNSGTPATLGPGPYPSIEAVLGPKSNDSLTGLKPANQ